MVDYIDFSIKIFLNHIRYIPQTISTLRISKSCLKGKVGKFAILLNRIFLYYLY